MDFVEEFQQRIGGRWIRVKFYFDELPSFNEEPIQDVRFCEAIKRSLIHPVLLGSEDLKCHGARYVFGWDNMVETEMVERFQQEDGFNELQAKELVQNLPRINGSLKCIGLNTKDQPDLLLSYLQPEQVMKLLRSYQVRYGKDLRVELSSIVSVCGHVAVEALIKKQITLSFGCRDSRRYGGITRDRVAVGVPVEVARELAGEQAMRDAPHVAPLSWQRSATLARG